MSNSRYFINPSLREKEVYKPLPHEELKEWIIKLIVEIESKFTCVPENMEGGIYTGLGGIAYMFYHIARSDIFKSEKNEFIDKGKEYLSTVEAYIQHKNDIGNEEEKMTKFGFLLEEGGIMLTAAGLCDLSGDTDNRHTYSRKYTDNLNIRRVVFDWDELFVGRSGYLCGLRWMQKITKKLVLPVPDFCSLCEFVVALGKRYSEDKRCRQPIMYAYHGVEYIGAAHGISFIMQVIMCFDPYMQHDEIREEIKEMVDLILEMQSPEGNFPVVVGEMVPSNDEDELVQWCHGAPGVIYMLAKAYNVWKEQKYLDACIKCGELIWRKGLLKKGVGLCHGVSGNAYAFILLYRLTNDEKYLYRATEFAKFILTDEFQNGIRKADSPYSLFEGTAGLVCFLTDLANPSEASFPFMDVF